MSTVDNYYGCIPALTWIFGHYFYNRQHYVWVAAEFNTYRLKNPKSSDPYSIYDDIYRPWRDADNFDKYLSQLRLGIRNGVDHKEKHGVISPQEAVDLGTVCDKIEVAFFYPLVVRVNVDPIPSKRKQIKGSGTVGSDEYLIDDLGETEFDMLFLDVDDADVKNLVVTEYDNPGSVPQANALATLQRRLLP